MVILKFMLRKQVEKLWSGFDWFGKGCTHCVCCRRREICGQPVWDVNSFPRGTTLTD